MVKDHSDSKIRNLLLSLQGLCINISSKGFFYIHTPTDRIVHTTTFVASVVKH